MCVEGFHTDRFFFCCVPRFVLKFCNISKVKIWIATDRPILWLIPVMLAEYFEIWIIELNLNGYCLNCSESQSSGPGRTKFIRLVRIKQNIIRIAYLYSKCIDCRINIYPAISTFAVQICYANRFVFMPVSQRVQMNFTFTDNVRILCLSCNVKEVGKLVRFRQKGQKQASFLAFHKCCQGCLLDKYLSCNQYICCTNMLCE
jgi:hypothetical protein